MFTITKTLSSRFLKHYPSKMAFSFGSSDFFNKTTPCMNCSDPMKQNDQSINDLVLRIICKKCAMIGFKHKRQATFMGKVINEVIALKKIQEHKEVEARNRMEELEKYVKKIENKGYPVRSRSYKENICEHSWGSTNFNNGPLSLSEFVLGDYLFEKKEFNMMDREFWIMKMMKNEHTTTRKLVLRSRLVNMASYVHPKDPTMALGYIMRKLNDKYPKTVTKNPEELNKAITMFKITNTTKSLKKGFKENADLLKKVIGLEGVRIASFLYDDKHRSSDIDFGIHPPEPEYSSAFTILDKSFNIIDSGKMLKSELSDILGGSVAADKLLENTCYARMLKQFVPGFSPEKNRVSKIANEMVLFSKSTEDERKKLVSVKYGRCSNRQLSIFDCWATAEHAKKYVDGSVYCEVDQLKKYFYNLTYNSGMFSKINGGGFFDNN